MKKILLCIFLCCHVLFSLAQGIQGTVMDSKHKALEGVSLSWIGTNISSVSDQKGKFTLDSNAIIDKRIVVRMLGYQTDTLTNFKSGSMVHLRSVVVLKGADVNFDNSGTMISVKPLKTEIISSKELKKAACCNLGESFETNATVDVTYKDALTGSKELQVLGLSGSYVQILTENAPQISGLGLTYGLNGIPGTQIESINIVKGPGSVIFGPESISGMINVDLKDPEKTDTWFINGYVDENLRSEINVDRAIKLNNDISTFLSLHVDDFSRKVDENGDNFLDMPMLRNVNFLNKWKYNNKRGWMSQLSYKVLFEERMTGQTTFDYDRSYADMSAWGQKIRINRYEAYGRTGYVLPTARYQSIGLQYSFVSHSQNGFYGIRSYDAQQNLFNARLIYSTELGKNHTLNLGTSIKLENINEQFDTLNLDRQENTPGFFIEDTYKLNARLTAVIGYRIDYMNNTFFQSPRANIKYSITDKTDIRASIGSGVRMPHVLAENPAFLVSSRPLNIANNLLPEQALNYGINLQHEFVLAYKKGSIGVDVYRTEFKNRLRIDLDTDPLIMYAYNLKNGSYSNSIQIEFQYKIFKTVDFKFAYKYLDVQTKFNGSYLRDPYIAQNRYLTTLSYESFDKKWRANIGVNVVGTKRLPKTHPHFGTENLPLQSPQYTIVNTQLTRRFKSWEWYIGAENLFDFKQMQHILGSDDPYGPYFDASYVWGPMDGRRAYMGFRYTFTNKKNEEL